MTPEQINTMMREADPDGSGEVDFEEFVVVLKTQMEAGGQLAKVVEEASSQFGFLNPFNWFKPKEPEAPTKEEATAKEAATPKQETPTKESAAPKKMTADELRSRLRPVFVKFDADGVRYTPRPPPPTPPPSSMPMAAAYVPSPCARAPSFALRRSHNS